MIDKAFRFWRLHGTGAAVRKVSDVVGSRPVHRVYEYWRQHGTDATVRQVARELAKSIPATQLTGPPPETSEQLIARQLHGLRSLPTQKVTRARPRLNMVTDSINPPHLYGGVGTAMIFAALLAERLGWELRIVTRSDQAQPENFTYILDLAKIARPGQVEFAFVPDAAAASSLELGEAEHFLTTSWWTTWPTRQAISPAKIIYLLQEDERMFYPHGDEHLRCSEVLQDPDITFLINTKILFDHLVQSGLANIARQGVWFEPSFPADIFHPTKAFTKTRPYRFLYYARPNNVRNLFYRGLEAIQEAVAAGIIDPEQWELCFVGKDIPKVRFARGLQPRRYQNLSWQDYAALVRESDLGLCLMYTPHPSYPPLDLAASGAVVVTNRFGPNKQSLDQYSKNIICTEPTVAELVRGIAHGVELAKDTAQRQANYQQNYLLRDWRLSFAQALDFCAKKFS